MTIENNKNTIDQNNKNFMTTDQNNQCISQEDDYIYCDFIKDFSKIFKSYDDLCDLFTEKFSKVFVDIKFGDGYMLKKDTKTDLHSRIIVPRTKFFFIQKSISKGKVVEDSMPILFCELKDSMALEGRIPYFSKETFKPCNYNLQRFEYNTWTGFKADEKDFQMDMEIINRILDYILVVISNNNNEVFKYILSWLRHIIVKPYKKTEVAIFLHSDEKGTGKGTLGYWLKNYVFGTHVSSVVCGLSKLTQKHNTCIQKKIFTMVEEIPATQGEFHSQFDTMKHLITDPEVTIEPKGVDPYEIPNMTNFLMMSNNVMALKIEKGDRRYACFEVSDSKKGDEEYWDEIHNEVLTEETAKHFFQYLKHLPQEECVSLRKIPMTALRETMINNSIPAHERFFMDIKDESFEIPEGFFMNEFEIKDETVTDGLRADSLYKIYESYCISRKEPVLRQRLFFNTIKKYVDNIRTTINGKTVRFYRIK